MELREDGTFLYTPKKNKVGVDSFTYTAADPTGKVSREATVTVKILKPTQAEQYTDTGNLDCRFEAEWLRSTGLFVGEQMGGAQCFQPEKSVTRGQFLAALTRLLELDVEEQASYTGLADTAPEWLKPYLAAAVRSGLAANWRLLQEQEPDPDAPITGAEAALMLQNALDLTVSAPVESEHAEDQAVWEETALLALEENGISLNAEEVLTRGQMAQLLYQVSRLRAQAPGLAVFRVDQ